MFRKKTVFVVGAGASNEFGFPLGTKLAEDIRTLTTPSQLATSSPCWPLIALLSDAKGEAPGTYYSAAKVINRGIPYADSIDDFIQQRSDDQALVDLGKLSISKLILDYESKSSLKSVTSGHATLGSLSVQNTWLFALAKMLFKEVRPSDVGRVFENIAIVSFNYDRSLECFFKYAIAEHFYKDLKISESVVRSAPICHVYGAVGGYLSQDREHEIEFGEVLTEFNYEKLENQIRTYAESAANTQVEVFIKKFIPPAEQIVFLGCGYHKQNIDILKVGEGLSENTRIFGTSFMMPTPAQEEVQRRLVRLFDRRFTFSGREAVELLPRTAADMLREYSMPLLAD